MLPDYLFIEGILGVRIQVMDSQMSGQSAQSWRLMECKKNINVDISRWAEFAQENKYSRADHLISTEPLLLQTVSCVW